jgi:hypothetical protein
MIEWISIRFTRHDICFMLRNKTRRDQSWVTIILRKRKCKVSCVIQVRDRTVYITVWVLKRVQRPFQTVFSITIKPKYDSELHSDSQVDSCATFILFQLRLLCL